MLRLVSFGLVLGRMLLALPCPHKLLISLIDWRPQPVPNSPREFYAGSSLRLKCLECSIPYGCIGKWIQQNGNKRPQIRMLSYVG